jgi:uncharacterized protein (UPF0332 family)
LQPAEEAQLRISKAHAQFFQHLNEGAHILLVTARPLEDLRHQAASDRLGLAQLFHEAGDKALRSRPPQFRTAISRYYYCMYHAMRAVVYFVNRGDDHDEHSVLPAKTPRDFSNAAVWQNRLKDARAQRNEADYDPYPQQEFEFSANARALRQTSDDLLLEAYSYLRAKGCQYV